MSRPDTTGQYVVCLANRGYSASLVVRRIYRTIPDPEAAKRGLLRIVDETGEDYLFPETFFAAIEISKGLKARLAT
jgi:hypothetical protein